MITVNGKELRNLEEQVLKNKQDIAAHYNVDRVLADFGIRVLGEVNTAADLPDPATFEGEYGDAYAVGAEAPYVFYIWTRPNPNDGHDAAYWLNIGQLAIVGPQGPKGDVGPQGQQGPLGAGVYARRTMFDGPTSELPEGSTVLLTQDSGTNKIGDILKRPDGGYGGWTKIGNIRGPQGIQGPQGVQGIQGPQGPKGNTGPAGPSGPIVDIIGILDNVDQLPSPVGLPRQNAYLIKTGDLREVYLITGPESNPQWTNAGLFATGTVVEENGEPRAEVNLDNYVKKPSTTTTVNGVNVITYDQYNGTVARIPVARGQKNVWGYTIPMRDAYGKLDTWMDFNYNMSADGKFTSTSKITQTTLASPAMYYQILQPQILHADLICDLTGVNIYGGNSQLLPREAWNDLDGNLEEQGINCTLTFYDLTMEVDTATVRWRYAHPDQFAAYYSDFDAWFPYNVARDVEIQFYSGIFAENNPLVRGKCWYGFDTNDENEYFYITFIGKNGAGNNERYVMAIPYDDAYQSITDNGNWNIGGTLPMQYATIPTQAQIDSGWQ